MNQVSKVRADEALRLVFRAKPNSTKWAMGAKQAPGKFPIKADGTHHKPRITRQSHGALKRARAQVWL
jgi:hypothetical protein